jgi:phosphate starvation-inducible PhoH-like protein|tara:strand:- start:8652 stop:9398 length:747 start_codon:yes stop_codon:yes gene_type:complete
MSRSQRKEKSRKNHKKFEVVHSNKRAEDLQIWNKPALVPKNKKQEEYINAVRNHKIVCSTGVAGSGKSYIASILAADMLVDRSSAIEKIVIARPNAMEGTQSIGLLPGTLEEKLAPWLAPIIETLKARLGNGHFDAYVANGKIEFLPLEMIKGRTLNNMFLICDESEDIQWPVLKTLLLRVGIDSKVVIDGDVRQTSIKEASGLQQLMDLGAEYYLPIKFVDFDSWEEHCVRSEECKLFGQIFEEAGV